MLPLSQSRSQTAPPPDASIPRLQLPQPPAHANPCCTACPSNPPDSVVKIESAFRLQENPLRLAFRGICSRQPCLICARQPCDAHHLRFAQARGLRLKVSDEFTVPLCRGHHRELHRAGNEAGWWRTMGVDAISAARKLWTE